MATKLFVAKLSFDSTDSSLEALFATFGTVISAVIIKDRDSNKSKGFGFVELESKEAADKAIAELDGKEFEGRTIAVSVARPREDRPSNGGFQRR